MKRYSITDIDGFSKTIREHAAMSLTSDELYTENLNDFISLIQVKTIIQNLSSGTDEEGYHIICDENFADILDEVRVILYQSALCKMAAAGHIECGWDDKLEEMTFWINDNKERVDIPSFPDYYEEDAEN